MGIVPGSRPNLSLQGLLLLQKHQNQAGVKLCQDPGYPGMAKLSDGRDRQEKMPRLKRTF